MIEPILAVNFDAELIADGDYAALYSFKRRDAMFAFAWREGERVFALRDHIGSVPLFYRWIGSEVRFATNLSSLVTADDRLSTEGVKHYLGLGTCKVVSLFEDIHSVPPGAVVEITPETTRILYQYHITPRKIPVHVSFAVLVDETDQLFQNAINRLRFAQTVGLYLSGGIDSALIGIYLKKLGVNINAYTSAPWGIQSSEIDFAKTNASVIGVKQQHIDILDSSNYEATVHSIPTLYGMPHATSTSIGVTSIWNNQPIAEELQVFFGQNSDTMTCSVRAQYYTLWMSLAPTFIRQRYAMEQSDIVSRYLSFTTKRLIQQHPYPSLNTADIGSVAQVTLAGMLVMHSPSDGEVLSQPAIHKGIRASNPYYDVDLIEFMAGIPLRHRLVVKRTSPYLHIEKRLFQALASRYLPESLVHRKKAFTVSLNRDDATRNYAASFPKMVSGIPLDSYDMKFGGEVLRLWCQQHGVPFS